MFKYIHTAEDHYVSTVYTVSKEQRGIALLINNAVRETNRVWPTLRGHGEEIGTGDDVSSSYPPSSSSIHQLLMASCVNDCYKERADVILLSVLSL